MADRKEVRNRKELFGHLSTAAASAVDPAAVLACMVAYTPPAERLIIRSEADLERLGTTAAGLKRFTR